MTFAELVSDLRDRFGDAIVGENTESRDPFVVIEPSRLYEVMTTLRDDDRFQFDTLSNLSGVDYLETDPKFKKFPYEPHLEVVYHLFSLSLHHRLTVKVSLPREDTPPIASVADLWSAANWHERECFDLYGIVFDGHPNLTRILCPDDWVGHPLRKDYEQPLEYENIRGR